MARKQAFTLIELLVVVLILAILMAIALPMYLNSISDSNRRTCQTNMKTIATALQSFRTRDDVHKYPADMAALLKGPTVNGVASTSNLDLSNEPKCPLAPTGTYTWTIGTDATGPIVIKCPDDANSKHGCWDNGSIQPCASGG